MVKAFLYSKTLTHVRHYRGHGVHSPFAYRLVRNVLMVKHVAGSDTALYDELTARGVSAIRSSQIQNLYTRGGYEDFVIDPPSDRPIGTGRTLVVLTTAIPVSELERYPAQVCNGKNVLCVLYPRESKRRMKTVVTLVGRHNGLSIDNRGFFLFFYDRGLYRQHIEL